MVSGFVSELLKYNDCISVMFHLGTSPFQPGAISIDLAYSGREYRHIDGYFLIDIRRDGLIRHHDVGCFSGGPIKGISLTNDNRLQVIGVDLL